MTWVLGGFAERIAAPAAALHAVPAGLQAAGAAMAEPLAAAVHAVERAGAVAHTAVRAAVLGGGTMGLMLARLLHLRGCAVTLADRHPERRAQATMLGARAVEALDEADYELVMEAVGRPEAWNAAIAAAAPGATVVLVGGCPSGSDVTLPAGPLHYAELDIRGAFHHTPAGGRPRALAAGHGRCRLARAGRSDDRPRRAARRARAPDDRRGAQARGRPASLTGSLAGLASLAPLWR